MEAYPIILLRLYKAFALSRMEYCAFLFHELTKKQFTESNIGQYTEQWAAILAPRPV